MVGWRHSLVSLTYSALVLIPSFPCLSVPSAPPDNIQIGMLNRTSAYVHWSPPPPQHHNGVILGYKVCWTLFYFPIVATTLQFYLTRSLQIQIKGNNSKILAQMSLNSSKTSVILNNLTTGSTYHARVVAFTKVGVGPYSQSHTLVMDPSFIHSYSSRWVLYLTVVCILVISSPTILTYHFWKGPTQVKELVSASSRRPGFLFLWSWWYWLSS